MCQKSCFRDRSCVSESSCRLLLNQPPQHLHIFRYLPTFIMRLLATGHAVRIARSARLAAVPSTANLRRAWSNAALEQPARQSAPPGVPGAEESTYEKTRSNIPLKKNN